MIPNEQQEAAIMHGLAPNAKWWEPREFPVGPQDLPTWLKGAHVDLNLQYATPPDVKLKIIGEPWPQGEPKLFEDEGKGAWTARSSDGWIMERHYHEGHVSSCAAWRLVGMDPNPYIKNGGILEWHVEPNQAAAQASAEKHLTFCRRDGSHQGATIETKPVLATEKQNGYGGRTFWITLKDGRELALRGPWHGGPPVGWTEAFMYRMERNRSDWRSVMCADGVVRRKTMRWFENGGSFGYFFSDDLIVKAVARYAPHMQMAMTYPGYGRARIEFYPIEWGAPKRFSEQRLPGWGAADRNAREAA